MGYQKHEIFYLRKQKNYNLKNIVSLTFSCAFKQARKKKQCLRIISNRKLEFTFFFLTFGIGTKTQPSYSWGAAPIYFLGHFDKVEIVRFICLPYPWGSGLSCLERAWHTSKSMCVPSSPLCNCEMRAHFSRPNTSCSKLEPTY